MSDVDLHQKLHQKARVVLASASPRRTQLLSQLGVSHSVQPADIDETPRSGEDPILYVRRMAESKAAAGVAALGWEHPLPVVLAADTTVVADGVIMGKPASEIECLDMLARLSARTHQVATAVCLKQGVRQASACVITQVTFRSVSLQEARAYWASGEPQDKAGGYGIQGAASGFVSKINGSYTGVIGLPLVETRALLSALNVIEVFQTPTA